MSVRFFEGAAGTGKTTRLITSLTEHIATYPLTDGQAVLAITFMHGSRKRLDEKLRLELRHLGKRYTCMTIDSFAETVVSRLWPRIMHLTSSVSSIVLPYDERLDLAARLLQDENTRGWIAAKYPILVVDEMQDCSGNRLKFIKGLSEAQQLFAAADHFQDLSEATENEAVTWLRSVSTPDVLETIHRTQDSHLLQTARMLREAQSIQVSGCVSIIAAPNKNVAAHAIARMYCDEAKGFRNSVILTPTGPEKAPFVKSIVERLRDPRRLTSGFPSPVGPFFPEWEQSTEVTRKALVQALSLPLDNSSPISLNGLRTISSEVEGFAELMTHLDYVRRITGKSTFTKAEILDEVERVMHRLVAFSSARSFLGIRAMTIQQAKNREFKGVIVLWPYQVTGSAEYQRRLLYNAITRAKQWAAVIVQCTPQQTRTRECPFTLEESTARPARAPAHPAATPPPPSPQLSLF